MSSLKNECAGLLRCMSNTQYLKHFYNSFIDSIKNMIKPITILWSHSAVIGSVNICHATGVTFSTCFAENAASSVVA